MCAEAAPLRHADRRRSMYAHDSLDLLPLRLPFTQTRLLEPAEFSMEAAKRRVRVEPGQLEVLHRAPRFGAVLHVNGRVSEEPGEPNEPDCDVELFCRV